MKVEILGVKIDNLAMDKALQKIEGFLTDGQQHYIVTPNPEFLVLAQKDERFQRILNKADLAIPDGIGLIFASWFLGQPLKQRVQGIDLMEKICQKAAQKKWPVFLLGDREDGLVEETAGKLKKKYPGLEINSLNKILGCFEEKITESVSLVDNRPAILFLALGAPKQEKWIVRNLTKMPSVKLAMGVGGAFNFMAGRVRRAPKVLRIVGLEWLWRFFCQPWRIKRIFKAVIVFLWLVVKGRASNAEPFSKKVPHLRHGLKAYFIGIKGVGMTALAQVLQDKGMEVLGSDTKEKFFTDQVLERLKIRVIEGFDKKNIPFDVDLVIVSAAYLSQVVKNPEVDQAKKQGLPLLTYAQILGQLFQEKYGLAVAGTHGKSTITAMLGLVLEEAGFDPTVIVGTRVIQWQSNARTGHSRYLVVEADEYRNNFLHYSPQVLVLTSLEYDHPDFFKNFQEYQETFQRLVQKIPASGFIVANGQDNRVKEVIKKAKCRVVEYFPDRLKIKLKVPGQHNLLNASAAMTTALELGVKPKTIKKALTDFQGTSRRFEIKGQSKGILLIDDYAHHPTEIQVTLKAAKESYPQKKIWAVFQPHTFSRTEALLKDFGSAFEQADQVIILDICGSAREKSGRVHAQDLVREIRKYKDGKVKYIPTIKEAAEYLKKRARAGQIVLTMGAGDVWKLSTILLF